MTPSHGEIIAGQKAYQRMRAYQRYKPTSSSAVVAFLILAVTTYNAIRMGEYSGLIFWMILILATYWQAQRQKARYQKDYEFLKELKTKYGIKVYEGDQTGALIAILLDFPEELPSLPQIRLGRASLRRPHLGCTETCASR